MKLHEFTNGLYPRRVTIYLVEKPINGIERVAYDPTSGWPAKELEKLNKAGTVPVLEGDNGAVIRSSIAILEYLEEKYPTPTMIGSTPEARARVRELVSVADEMTTYLTVWNHEGSPLFARSARQNKTAGAVAARAYYKKLAHLEEHATESGGPFLAGENVTIADCVTMATVQFAEALYGVPMPPSVPVLASWYSRFIKRPSAVGCVYPQQVLDVARGLPEHCPPAT